MMPPVLSCLSDQDPRVRYYACESMYNICKVTRGLALSYFNELFDALSKLAADSELSVKNGADLLDRLIKDVVSEQKLPSGSSPSSSNDEASAETSFSLDDFIPLLAERIYTVNSFTRSFLISWLQILDSVPHLELISYLSEFLDGLIGFVGDNNEDVRVGAMNLLGEFLQEAKEIENERIQRKRSTLLNADIPLSSVQEKPHLTELTLEEEGRKTQRMTKLPYRRIMTILVPHTRSFACEHTQLVALTWMTDFVSLFLKEIECENEVFNRIISSSPDASDYQERLEIEAQLLSHIEQYLESDISEIMKAVPEVVGAILPCLANSSPSTKKITEKCDKALKKLVIAYLDRGNLVRAVGSIISKDKRGENFDFIGIVNSLTVQFLNENEKTRVSSLEWLIMLHKKAPNEVMAAESGTFPALLKTLSDASEQVVKRDLQLLAQISSIDSSESDGGNLFFSKFISSLLVLFSSDRRLLEQRGSLIIRQLALHVNPEEIFRVFSNELVALTKGSSEKYPATDLEFARTMVQHLNLILMTSKELSEVRYQLKSSSENSSGLDGSKSPNTKSSVSARREPLFVALYKSWSHDSVAVLSLCLLAQAYEHACALLQTFAEMDLSVSLLVQLDKLVQLLESPAFTYLRLQLLEPEKYPHLYKCLYGILMLLPQSSAYLTLRNRLNSVNSLTMMIHGFQTTSKSSSPIRRSYSGSSMLLTDNDGKSNNYHNLLAYFTNVQHRHVKTAGTVSSNDFFDVDSISKPTQASPI